MQPSLRPDQTITLVSSNGTALYSGMVPALIAGLEKREKASINLRWLAQQAGVAFIQATVRGIDPQGGLQLLDRPDLSYGTLSLNVGAVTQRQDYLNAIAVKPLEPALHAISSQDALGEKPNADPFHCVGAGLAAIEIAIALRQRWPRRSLILHTGNRLLRASMRHELSRAQIQLSDAPAPDTTNTLLCTGSEAPRWLSESELLCDTKGRVLTHPTLQALNHPQIFASGYCGVIQGMERPPTGVLAFRASKPLAQNLKRLSCGQPPEPWHPQRRALQLIGLSNVQRQKAWLLWGSMCLGPHPLLWHWKQKIDHRFMKRFRQEGVMQSDPKNQGHHVMACRGCAAKLPAEPLQQALSICQSEELASRPEDAHALGTNSQGGQVLASVDGFPALISDPWVFCILYKLLA